MDSLIDIADCHGGLVLLSSEDSLTVIRVVSRTIPMPYGKINSPKGFLFYGSLLGRYGEATVEVWWL